MNDINIDELKSLRNIIDNIDEFHHKKIFEIIKMFNMNYSRNKNGIFVNMNNLSQPVLDELKTYLLYINKQEKTFGRLSASRSVLRICSRSSHPSFTLFLQSPSPRVQLAQSPPLLHFHCDSI